MTLSDTAATRKLVKMQNIGDTCKNTFFVGGLGEMMAGWQVDEFFVYG